jgi:hypothetical protein
MMSEANITIETRLDAPDLSATHRLQPILASALRDAGSQQAPDKTRAFWTAGHFHLNKVAIFNAASNEEQEAILLRCSQSLLAEAYYIEKCGMYFAPKMCLLAESSEEKMLYSLFAADEARHFHQIAAFVTPQAVSDYLHNPFIQLLDEILRYGNKTTLTYIVQVLLEGWGIRHYHALAANARDTRLIETLATILKDEARHHGSGLLLFNEKRLTEQQVAEIIEPLIHFFRMVQIGPQLVVLHTEEVMGHLSHAQRETIFAELDAEAGTERKLALLKSLIQTAAYADDILARLESAGALRAFSAAECAAIL